MKTSLNQQSQILSEEGLNKLKALNFKDRFYRHDATLWKTEKECRLKTLFYRLKPRWLGQL